MPDFEDPKYGIKKCVVSDFESPVTEVSHSGEQSSEKL